MDTKKRVRRGVIVVALLALLTGGYLWHHEGTPAVRLANFCDGVLPVDEMLRVTGTNANGFSGGRLGSLHTNEFRNTGELGTVCSINKPGAFRVSIEAMEDSKPFATYVSPHGGEVLPIPLGNSWSGFLAPSEKALSGSVVLDCPGWREGQGKGILVTGAWGNVNGYAPEIHKRLAKIITTAAERTAEQTACKAELGTPVNRIDRAVTKAKEADRATGTCEGVESQRTVLETAASTAPVEYCILKDGLRLSALYGEFAGSDFGGFEGEGPDDLRGENKSTFWGTAQCSGGLQYAQFTAAAEQEGEREGFSERPPTAQEYADLRTFAERSADRHGCKNLTLPPKG